MMVSAQTLLAAKISSRGARGVVASASPEAAVIGRTAFAKGGNAFDAALSAALAETVLLPPKCGLAGDLAALCVTRGQPPVALTAIGTAADRLYDSVVESGVLPTTGALSVGVPGAPAGYAALGELSRLGRGQAAQPAIELAREGFAWSPICVRYTQEAVDLLREHNPDGTVYLPGGAPAQAGSRVQLRGLAKLLEAFASDGAALFKGAAGKVISDHIQARGGVITPDDLAAQQVEQSTPAEADLDGITVWATPFPTHGPSLLSALDRTRGATTITEMAELVQSAIVDRQRLTGSVAADAGTSVVAAADAEGNAVVLVHSNSHPTYGSGIVVPEYDLILSNRAGRGFNGVRGHRNAPWPGHRPATTLHAWALGHNDSPTVLGATSGGEQQMPWNVQLVSQLLEGKDPATAMLAPLWSYDHLRHAVQLEHSFADPEDGDGLHPVAGCNGNRSSISSGDGKRSSTVVMRPALSMRSGMQVVDVSNRNILAATADLRVIGGTAAY